MKNYTVMIETQIEAESMTDAMRIVQKLLDIEMNNNSLSFNVVDAEEEV